MVAAGDYARGKPNPDPFLTAAARLGVRAAKTAWRWRTPTTASAPPTPPA